MAIVALISKEIEVVASPEYNQEGEVMIRQTDPLPLTVVLMTLEVSIEG